LMLLYRLLLAEYKSPRYTLDLASAEAH
jgi:hypothetical protein